MASPAPSRPTPREPDRRRCRRPPPTPQLQVAHPPGEPPNSSFLSPSRQFPPIRRHRAIIQLPDLGLMNGSDEAAPRRGRAWTRFPDLGAYFIFEFFAQGGPMVRIHLPPAESPLRTCPTRSALGRVRGSRAVALPRRESALSRTT